MAEDPKLVGSRSYRVSAGTITVSTAGAYPANGVVQGVLTFPNVFRPAQPSGIIQSAGLVSSATLTNSFELWLFTQYPTATTWTDRSAAAIVAADLPYLIPNPILLSSANSDLGTLAVYANTALNMQASSANGTLYGILLATSTVTFSATNAIVKVEIGVLQD